MITPVNPQCPLLTDAYGGWLQLFRMNTKGQMAVGERCLDLSGKGITMQFCPVDPTGPWEWDQVRRTVSVVRDATVR